MVRGLYSVLHAKQVDEKGLFVLLPFVERFLGWL